MGSGFRESPRPSTGRAPSWPSTRRHSTKVVEETLGALLKYRDDIDKVRGERAKAILERVAAGV
jgi:hypothetical protein